MEVIFIIFEIAFALFMFAGVLELCRKFWEWIFNGKIKPGKWHPIKWTEFKYRPGGKNGVEWLYPNQIIAQIPFKPTLPIWCIVIDPIYCPSESKNIYFYEIKNRQKATYRCWKENFCDNNIQWLTFEKFLKVTRVVEVEKVK